MESAALEAVNVTSKISSAQLPYILNHDYAHIKILSLDCFDTLLWRMTSLPRDVFLEMQHSAPFKSIGLTATLRAQSEAKARGMRKLHNKSIEIKLQDIYREYLPALSEEEISALSQAEIEAEQAACYAFPPVIELIRKAKRQGIKVILVSDTYFTEKQLRLLLKNALSKDVLDAIEKIFCSSEHDFSKKAGLFNTVIRHMNETAENILHIGDSKEADYTAPRALKMHALHLIQDNDYVKNLHRLHTIAANLMNPAIRSTKALSNPFRGLYALSEPNLDHPGSLIGYYSLGSILYGFSEYIVEEVEKLRVTGVTPKVVFLMRDGYLPELACNAFAEKVIGHSVSISRFVAYAASFRTEADVNRYLMESVKSRRFSDITRQLLLPNKVAEPILRATEQSATPEETFSSLIHRNDVMRMIFKKSIEYFARLKCYLEKQIGLKSGDHLLFVDLGYAGTAQRLLAPLLKESGVNIEGRYLIALQDSAHESFRAGLLDSSHYDNKTLFAILHFISLLEQLCTSNSKSVVDYDSEGKVIYSDIGMSDQQHLKVSAIQSECIRFVKHAKDFFKDLQTKVTPSMRRDYILAELTRLIYLPTGPELHYLQSFQFDLNLGTKDIYPLFDPKKGLDGLKRRGLFYVDRHGTSKRTHYPAELRIAGFELALTYLANMRHHVDANLEDMLPRKEFIETQIKQPTNNFTVLMEAYATHDGYFALCTSAGAEFSFCIGKRYQWIQIESAELIKERAFEKQQEAGNVVNIKEYLSFKNIKDHGNGLLECISPFAMISVQANSSADNIQHVFRLVYRPLVFQHSQL